MPRNDLKVLIGGKSESRRAALQPFRKLLANAAKLSDCAEEAEQYAHDAVITVKELFENTTSTTTSIAERRRAKQTIALYEEVAREATAFLNKVEAMLKYAEEKLEDKVLELADIPEEWRENAVVEPIDLDDEDSALAIYYGNVSDPGTAWESWDGYAILHANGDLERVSTPKKR